MPSVLVVDDATVDRRLAGGLLEKNTIYEVRYAANGAEAIEQVGMEIPDLILTDLQMPEIDGLELVSRISHDYPDVPVVLMTAHGSEAIAAQALANGAASYVPKRDLANILVDTVSNVMAIAQSDQLHRKLIQCTTKTEFEFELRNEVELVAPLVQLVEQILTSMRLWDANERVRIGVAVEHAVYNAMVRGNFEIKRDESEFSDQHLINQRKEDPKYSKRTVRFGFRIDRQQAVFTIVDQGHGFDLQQVPKSGDPESFREGVGRGLVLMSNFMDDVTYEDNGSRITMTKNLATDK